MATYARKRLFVDAEVQGRFALRAVAYWLGCMTVVMGMAMSGRLLMKPTEPFFTSSESLWACLAPLVLATVLVLPVMVYDIIVVTHRLVGPILRGVRDATPGPWRDGRADSLPQGRLLAGIRR